MNTMTFDAINVNSIANICGGHVLRDEFKAGGGFVYGVSRDTNDVKRGDLFVCIKGERHDGHSFAPEAAESGAAAILTEHAVYVDIPQIIVKDSVIALGKLAAWHLAQFPNLKVFSVTGSVGKTTTKDMIAKVLSKKYATVATEGNLNNNIGLPLTIMRVNAGAAAAVLEMGMNHAGEIDYLARICSPNYAVITNIGTAHIEFLGSREAIFKAKTEVFAHMREDGLKILNADDDMLRRVKNDTLFYGILRGDIRAYDIEESFECVEFTLKTPKEETRCRICAPGLYNVYAALAAAACGFSAGLSIADIADGIEAWRPGSGRGNIINTKAYTILDGSYNASPESMKAGLEALRHAKGRKVAILGGMKELGAKAAALHNDVLEYAKERGVVVFAVGFGDSPLAARSFDSTDSLIENLRHILKAGDCVFVKASHSMGFDKVVAEIAEMGEANE